MDWHGKRVVRAADLRLVAILPTRGRGGSRSTVAMVVMRPLLMRTFLHQWVGARCECEDMFSASDVASLLMSTSENVAEARGPQELEREMAALRTGSDVVVAAFLSAAGDEGRLVGYARASGDRSLVCSIDRVVLRAENFAFETDVVPCLLSRLAQQAHREYGIVDIAHRTAGSGGVGYDADTLAAAGFEKDRLGSSLLRYRDRNA